MDIRQIEFFVAVAEELNFTRAAELTYVTQSGLSSAVRGLERELRTQLFDRTSRTVALTAAGHAFLPRARRMLEDARAAQRELAGADAMSGTLGIGTEQCLGDLLDLPDLLAAFQQRFPDITVRFQQLGSRDLLNQLHRGELNAALVAHPGDLVPPGTGPALHAFEMSRAGFELVLSPEHPAAGLRQVSWPDYERYAFVDFDTAWTARQIVDTAFATRRLVRRTAYVVNDVHLLLDLVRRGLGIALVPAPIANKPHADGLLRLPVPEPDLRWFVHVVSATDSGPAARLFAEMMFTTETLAEMRDGLDEVTSAVG